jgi:hypothetical protein
MVGSGACSAFLLASHTSVLIGCAMAGLAAVFGAGFLRARPTSSPNSSDRLLQAADKVAKQMRELSTRRRLHLVLHPGVSAVLDECAGFWRRIMTASDVKRWSDTSIQPHWQAARRDWIAAADLAMAEALTLAEAGMNFRRPRPEEVVEDILDTYVFQRPKQSTEPLPGTYGQLRDLAETLKALAKEVEQVSVKARLTDGGGAAPNATHRLEEVLADLRSLETAEDELQRNLNG